MKNVILLSLLLTGCSQYEGPYKICLNNHKETYTVMVYIGKVMTPQIRVRNVCDKYSIQEYIKVNKTIYEVQKIYEEK